MHTLLAAPVVLLAASVSSPDDVRERVERAPKEVAAFIERRANCNHFLGEERYDRERAAYIDRAVRKLRCHRLEQDESRLRRAYRDDPAILALLDETADSLGW